MDRKITCFRCGKEIKQPYYCKPCLEIMQDELIEKWVVKAAVVALRNEGDKEKDDENAFR